MRLSRKEFLKYAEEGTLPTTMPKHGKVDWDAVFKELKKTHGPIDIATIQEHYVHNKVVRRRTKNVLNEWFEEGKCLRLVHNGRYVYLFRIPKDFEAQE